MVTTHRLTIDQVKAGRDWSALENALLRACKQGGGAYLPGKEDCPTDQGDPDRRVRPALIRYLLEGGCDGPDGTRPHPTGVQLHGAWIDGILNCDSCATPLDLGLGNCLFEQSVSFRDARLGALYLSGSRAKKGLNLHRIQTEKDLHLRAGAHVTGLVDLASCKIGGQLACDGGRFDGGSGMALNCEAAQIGADAILSGGFHATGLVNFLRSVIGGQLACTAGRFDGGSGMALTCDAAQIGADMFLRHGFHATGLVDFTRAQVTGNFRAETARFDGGLILDSARIGSGLFWQGIAHSVPVLNLTETRAGTLLDDAGSWRQVGRLRLSGFVYDHIQSDMGVSDRLDWLARKSERALLPDMPATPGLPSWIRARDTSFDPQPYSQLAKVLEADGNRAAAARVMAVREDLLRRAERGRAWARMSGRKWYKKPARIWAVAWRLIWALIFKYVFGYGYHPVRALRWMAGIWLFGVVLYGAAYASGQMVPNSDVILTSADWLAAARPYFAGGTGIRPATAWAQTPPGQDYETFSAMLYALDLFVPLDALGQETTWAPSKAYGWLGTLAYWMRMPIQLAGWIITAVGAAVLTGLIGKKD